MKLTPGQIAALKWMGEEQVVCLPSTTNPPYRYKWDEHKPATVQAFYSLRRKGLARLDDFCFWKLTDEGRKAWEAMKSPFEKGDWVAEHEDTNRPSMGVVRDCYNVGGDWCFDLVLFDDCGHQVGRRSPPEGGPTKYEPACPCAHYRKIERPDFPLRLDAYHGYASRLKFINNETTEQTPSPSSAA